MKLRPTLAVAAAIASLAALVVSQALAQSMEYDTTNPVNVTCAAAGTNFQLSPAKNYRIRAAVESVTWRIGTDGDGGTCASGGTTLDPSGVDFIKARRLGDSTATGSVVNGCCKSTAGTGTLQFVEGRVTTQ